MLAGCSDMAQLIAPAGTVDTRPARVAFTASVATASSRATDVVALRVASSYVLAGGTRQFIGSQLLSLTSDKSQSVPIPVDLATCLADPSRDGGGAECSVFLELALEVNSVVVDRQTIGPIKLTPGGQQSISQPVSLFEITALTIAPSAPISLVVGANSTVVPTVKDAQGNVVTGRPVTFTSDDPTTASVDANGKITAVKLGQTRVTATLGALSASVAVNVIKPAVALTIAAPAVSTGAGSIRSTPAGIDCRVSGTALTGTCAFNFAADAQVVLTSTPDAGTVFGAWSGACVGNAIGANCTLNLAQPVSTSAQFAAQRRVTITSTGSDGRGRITGAFGVDCRIDGAAATGSCAADVPDGTSLLLTATPDAANGGTVAQVTGPWGGDCASASGATCTVTPNGAARAVSLGFFNGRALTLTLAGNGTGNVTANGLIDCSRANNATTGTCTATTVHGANVTLVATTDATTGFAGWSGSCSGSSTVCVVAMTQARAATANFTRNTVPLTLVLSGSGNGTLSVNGAVACTRTNETQGSVTCVKDIDIGTVVTITGAAGDLTDYLGNSGLCVAFEVCTLTMSTARTITGNFASKAPVTISIAGLSNGTGSVRSTESTPLVDCRVVNGATTGNKCSVTVPNGTTIRLQAIGDAGNALLFWGGYCAGRGTYECVITANASSNVIVGFAPAIDVDMQLTGSGRGSVTFDLSGAPSQVPCTMSALGVATTCRFSLPTGLSGVFRGVPAAGSRFDGVVGPCAESTNGNAVPVCTYRGIGFLRTFTATFTGN